MKIGIVGANGRLGQKLVAECNRRGHEVYAIVREGDCAEAKKTIRKSLFDLTREDVDGLDCILSAFGGGFKADPKINKEALEKLAELVKGRKTRIICIGGAGLLYTDHTHAKRVYEGEDHPAFLKGISENIKLGLDSLRRNEGVSYTLVCPSLFFDYEGKRVGRYKVGTEEEVLFSASGESRISYEDLSLAMVDEAEAGRYINQCITICEE